MGYGSSKREKMSIKSKNVDIEKGMLYNSTYFYGKPLSGGVALIIESYRWCDGSILNQCEWACEGNSDFCSQWQEPFCYLRSCCIDNIILKVGKRGWKLQSLI